MGRYRTLSMKVKSKKQLPWAKEMLIVASRGALSDGFEFADDLIADKDEVLRYYNGTLTAEEQKKFSDYFAEIEAHQDIEWNVEGNEITAFPAFNNECFAYMGGYYDLCKEIVTANPKLEFIFTAQYEDNAVGLSSGTTCKVQNGKFYYETGEWLDDSWLIHEGDSSESDEESSNEQYHIVEGELIKGKYKFEVVSEFDKEVDVLW